MKPEQAKNELTNRVAQLEANTVEQLIDAMIVFYRDQRIDGLDLDADGDMLLFQWGTYDWGEGESFELDIARQFLDPEEDEPLQLHILMKFPPTEATKAFEDGNKWCDSPIDIASFNEFIHPCGAYLAMRSAVPASVEIDFEKC